VLARGFNPGKQIEAIILQDIGSIMTRESASTDSERSFDIDRLAVRVFPNRYSLGVAAANEVATAMKDAIAEQGRVRIAFAAAPSQNEFLATLAANPDIDWQKVTGFQLDEYVGLPEDAPQLFGSFLREHLFDAVMPGTVHLIGTTESTEAAIARCREYSALIDEEPLDIVCLGIGENGHLAFNDPPVADFNDPERVKVVELDQPCRQQQVNDGCFATFAQVPTHAITLTIPTLLSGRKLVCIVPGMAKRQAVTDTLQGPISTACPASILRTHPACTLFLDADSYGEG
jgi:glucosamine-6-phosphate deaminase